MRNLLTLAVIVFCTTCFSQKIYIKKGSDKTRTTIKIVFPKEYNLLFYRNNVLLKSIKFEGTKKFTIEDFEQLEFAYKDQTKQTKVIKKTKRTRIIRQNKQNKTTQTMKRRQRKQGYEDKTNKDIGRT